MDVIKQVCIIILFFILFFKYYDTKEISNGMLYYDKINILGLFGPEQQEQEFAFKTAVAEANNYQDMKIKKLQLVSHVERLSPYDSFNISKTICRETREGIGGIFGPDFEELTSIVRSMSDMMNIPHIDTRWDTSNRIETSKLYINLYPDAFLLATAIYQVADDMDWETFTLIYESADSLLHLQEVLKTKMKDSAYERPQVVMKQLPENEENYRPFLKEISKSLETRIMLHCSPHKVINVLRKAKDVNLLGQYQSFFITSLDAHIMDLREFSQGPSNITTLRLIYPDNHIVRETVDKWRKADPDLRMTEETVKTDTALMRDSVILFSTALCKLHETVTTDELPCSTQPRIWQFGRRIIDEMKKMDFIGMSGRMKFDEESGRRQSFTLDIVEISKNGFRSLGTWDPVNKIKHRRNITQMFEESIQSIENKTLRVVSKQGLPYLQKKDNESLVGNDRFEGYAKDLMDEIAKELKFTYTLEIVKNNEYGKVDEKTGKWSGMIGELREMRADLAICDFTITHDRKKAIDFSLPFMSLGISILHTKPPPKETSMFSFLDPFDIAVWSYAATAYLTVSIALFLVARCTPYEWEGAHPCDNEPQELENGLNLKNCLWWSLGTVLQQGSDILPKAWSTRLVASMWCFYTLIFTSTYTANLAAFLTTHRMESPIKSVDQLANQDKVKYGCYINGSTAAFFRNSNDSLYQRMWATMESANPTVFTESNDRGVERVLKSKNKYAFFMESSTIEYEMARNCELTMVGGLLDSKGYGIAMPLGSTHRKAINSAILKFQETRVLAELKERWWKNPNNKTCPIPTTDEDKDKLDVSNVGGVFVLLACGCLLAFIVSVLEFLWNVRKVAVREKITLSEAFCLELKFAFQCRESTKPVRHTPQSDAMATPLSISQTGFDKLIINKCT